MEKSNEVDLGSVQETLLIPLWIRAMETQKKKPLLIDNKAVEIVNNITYDFTPISKNSSRINRMLLCNGVIMKFIYYDKKIKEFIDLFPEATIVNIGCGLDTTFSRVDNGKIQWIDLDLPDVIYLKKEYFTESERNRFIAKSVFDTSWYDSIENKDHVMLLIAGLLCYFNEGQVKRLFQDFQTYLSGTEMVFEVVSKLTVKNFNRAFEKSNKSVRMFWSNSNVHEIEKWNCGLEVMDTMPTFKEHRQHYPLIERIVMSVFDAFKLSTLAHVKIHPR